MSKRIAGIPGAAVEVVLPRELVLIAPGADLSVFDGLTRAARLNIRPVLGAWNSPGILPASTVTIPATPTPGAVGTGTSNGPPDGTSAAAATSDAAASEFPAGSDTEVPTQPAGTDQAAWTAWEAAMSAAYTAGTGPTCAQINTYQGLDKPDKPLLSCDQPAVEGPASTVVYLLDATLVAGTEISDATAELDTPSGNGWAINVTFKSTGFKIWSNYTAGHIGTQTAFTLDGQVLSAPTIQQVINTPTTMVSGSFNQTTAKALADSLTFGALPLSFDVIQVEHLH